MQAAAARRLQALALLKTALYLGDSALRDHVSTTNMSTLVHILIPLLRPSAPAACYCSSLAVQLSHVHTLATTHGGVCYLTFLAASFSADVLHAGCAENSYAWNWAGFAHGNLHLALLVRIQQRTDSGVACHVTAMVLAHSRSLACARLA
jgi:hypothetical protein